MEWFFALNDYASGWFNEMAKVAVLSAKERTTLEAHCLYSGAETDLSRWIDDQGVIMHRTEVPFYDELFSDAVMKANEGSIYSPRHAAGNFLRTISHQYAADDVFLYTDCDVMFLDDRISALTTSKIAVAQELNAKSFNAGIMLINKAFYASEFDSLVSRIRAGNFYFIPASSYDQAFHNQHFDGRWDMLPPEFNWRPWGGINDAASIVHFHGPKPHRVEALLNGNAGSGEEGLIKFIQDNKDAYQHYVRIFDETMSAHNAAKLALV